MKLVKRIIAMVLIGVMIISTFVGCGNNKETKKHKIGFAHYTDSGRALEAIKEYLKGISEDVGCEFVFTTLSTYDEATNLTEIQNLISAGCQGIIMSADMGTAAILEECKAAGVYLAGFLCDYNMSYYTAYDKVFGNEHFLGTVCDGKADQSEYGIMVAERIIESGYKNVGVVLFPAFAYPNQALVDAAFRSVIDEYNATASEPISIVDTIELPFTPLESTYLSEHPEIDCIFSMAAGNVYPTLVANNRTDIKLFTIGFDGADDVENFGSSGNQCFQATMCSTPEAIAYPLCLLIDKLNGKTYADLPEHAERVDCSLLYIMDDDDMKKVVESSLYYTVDYSKSFLTGEDVKNLCASYNENATYAGLVEAINKMGVENLK